MKEKHFEPGIGLQEVVSSFYYFSTEGHSEKEIKFVAPNLEMMLILNFGASFKVSFNKDQPKEKSIEKFAVVGPLRNRLNYEQLPGSNTIVVNFILDGFYRIFEMNLSRFNGNILMRPYDLLPLPIFADLWNKLKPYDEASGKIEKLKEYLSKIINRSEAQKIGLIHKEKSSSHFVINTLYKAPASTSVSNRTVQINFKKYFGYSVKEKIRLERFKNIIAYLLSSDVSSVNWKEIINRFGYYDQSHLYKDFKKFLSTTPKNFIKNTQHFCVPKGGPGAIDCYGAIS